MQGIIKGLDHAVIVFCIVANTREILSEGWKMCGKQSRQFLFKLFEIILRFDENIFEECFTDAGFLLKANKSFTYSINLITKNW